MRSKRYPYNVIHGDSAPKRVPEYGAWADAIQRCYNPNNPVYHRYGGRGIRMCEEWRNSYMAFLSYMGRRPSPKHSLDRFPNRDGDYEPGNVRWATNLEQQRNTERVKVLTAFGRTQLLVQWVKEFGIPKSTVRHRLKRGWSPEDALSKKPIPLSAFYFRNK